MTKSQTSMSFSYNEYDGADNVSVNTTISGDKAGYLPSILEAFSQFLIRSGFCYLNGEVERVPSGYLIKDGIEQESEEGRFGTEELTLA